MPDLIGLIQAQRPSFSRAERQLVDTVLADIEAALADSIVELAARAAISPPTITRFCRRIECQSFAEFKVRLAQSRFLGARYLARRLTPQTPPAIADHVFNSIQATLHAFHGSLDYGAIEQAAERIAGARFVLVFGSGGGSSMIAAELENRLFRLGIAVSASTDHQAQLMRAAAAPAGSVIVAASFSGGNQPLAEALKSAAEYQSHRIVLTRPGSLVAAEADTLLAVALPEGPDILRPTATRYAYLALVDVLAQVTATRLGDGAIESLRRVKHQLVSVRDLDDSQPLGD